MIFLSSQAGCKPTHKLYNDHRSESCSHLCLFWWVLHKPHKTTGRWVKYGSCWCWKDAQICRTVTGGKGVEADTSRKCMCGLWSRGCCPFGPWLLLITAFKVICVFSWFFMCSICLYFNFDSIWQYMKPEAHAVDACIFYWHSDSDPRDSDDSGSGARCSIPAVVADWLRPCHVLRELFKEPPISCSSFWMNRGTVHILPKHAKTSNKR